MEQTRSMASRLSAQDEREIAAVLVAYASGIDRRDWQLFRSLFTVDCETDYGAFGKWHGAEAICEYMRQAHAGLGPTLHRITNIEIRTVAHEVHARSYVDALLKPINDDGPLHRGVGYYEDILTHTTANGWQIARRQFHALLLE